MRKILVETLKKFSQMRKKWLQERSSATSFTQITLSRSSNHKVFLVQFGINMHLRVFKRAEIAPAEVADVQFQLVEKLACAN